VIAAIGANELEHAGIAAFGAAVHDADRLAPQVRRAAMAGLTGERAHVDAVSPDLSSGLMAGAECRLGPFVVAILASGYDNGPGCRAG
jgi:hypothetical protein